ncbi:hypothetical protein G9A89_009053 [Geosiphon pyriformis]|nr:hypothetical protein G9A89_009053 [Geosiphon pyriformis]
MAFGNDDSTLQFATVFIMFLLWFLTLIPVRIAQSRMQDGLDNANPRDQYRKLPAWGQRAVAVTNNTFEAFCFFSVAVFTHAFSGPRSMSVVHAVDAFCILFIVIRVLLYNSNGD